MTNPPTAPGQTFGSLTILRRTGTTGSKGNEKPLWIAACTCGGTITNRSDHLRKQGHCGCQRKYVSKIRTPYPRPTPNPNPDAPKRSRKELEIMTARQMRISGEKLSVIAAYLDTDIETTKQRLKTQHP